MHSNINMQLLWWDLFFVKKSIQSTLGVGNGIRINAEDETSLEPESTERPSFRDLGEGLDLSPFLN
jgi:hypothetical protein